MKTAIAKSAIMATGAAALALMLSGCGGGGGGGGAAATGSPGASVGSEEAGTGSSGGQSGYLIDTSVAAVEVSCPDGTYLMTDTFGSFSCDSPGEISFSLGRISLGRTRLSGDGEAVTPEDLGGTKWKLMAQTLQSLDIDSNLSNGIYPDSRVVKDLYMIDRDVNFSSMDEQALMDLSPYLANKIDNDFDGKIDVSPDAAAEHVEESIRRFQEEGWRPVDDPALLEANSSLNSLWEKRPYIGIYLKSPDDYERCILRANGTQKISHLLWRTIAAYDLYSDWYEYEAAEVKDENFALLHRFTVRLDSLRARYAESFALPYVAGEENPPTLEGNRGKPGDRNYGESDIDTFYSETYDQGLGDSRKALEQACVVEVSVEEDIRNTLNDVYCREEGDLGAYILALSKDTKFRWKLLDARLKKSGVSDGCCHSDEGCWEKHFPGE